MKTAKQVLIDARALIAAGWAQEAFARNAAGKEIDYYSDAAVCFCSVGALTKAALGVDRGTRIAARLALRKHVPTGFAVVEWNDEPGRTQEEVLAAFDAAIEELA